MDDMHACMQIRNTALVCLDPNFPGWNDMDRVLAWNVPQAAKAMGMPHFLLRFIFNMTFLGPIKKAAKWGTEAEREKCVQWGISKASNDDFETMLVHTELDTGVVVDTYNGVTYDSPMALCKALKGDKMTQLAEVRESLCESERARGCVCACVCVPRVFKKHFPSYIVSL